MQGTKDGNNQPEKRNRDENLVVLFRHLYHNKFCPDENVADEQKTKVLAAYYCGWLDKHMTLMDPATECEAAGVDDEIWQFALNLISSGSAPESLFGVWYSIVIPDRPDPKHALQSINLICNMTFADGSISTSQAFVSREMFDGPVFNDHIVAGIVRNNMRAVLDAMVEQGLDKLWEQAQKNPFTSPAPEDPFHVFMGWCIKHMVGGEPPPGQLRPDLKPAVLNYIRLAQQCIRPPIPEHYVSAWKARQAQAAAKEAGKPRGGWDV